MPGNGWLPPRAPWAPRGIRVKAAPAATPAAVFRKPRLEEFPLFGFRELLMLSSAYPQDTPCFSGTGSREPSPPHPRLTTRA